MKIVITNTVALNVGDAAILKGVLKILQATFGEETEFIVYDRHPEVAQRYYPELRFKQLIYYQCFIKSRIKRPVRLVRYFNRTRVEIGAWCWKYGIKAASRLFLSKEEYDTFADYYNADLIVSTGGTYLVENYLLAPRILDYKISLQAQKPLVFFTQSLGPFNLPFHRKIFKRVFDQAALILLRDCQSQKHLDDIGVDNPHVYVTPDAAFALAEPLIPKAQPQTNGLTYKPRIAISVRNWQHFKRIDPKIGQRKYQESLQILITYFVEKYQAEVTFISTCQGIPEYYLDDSSIAQEIYDALPLPVSSSVQVNSDFHAPEALAEFVKTFDFVIATRLHMAILSLGVGVPVFPISYEFKTKELFEKMGEGRWTVDIEDIEPEAFVKSVDTFFQEIEIVRNNLITAVEQERTKAFETCLLLKEIVELV
ncbi:MAG: polysaccharide pyruvyl transferase family protein [Elainella sp. Prado103]|jgi:colanic acid/amylovoran biosynthesis protein|nr:polysaccharide pyruvyl transferase family protein [Elainella sp. Prado103]